MSDPQSPSIPADVIDIAPSLSTFVGHARENFVSSFGRPPTCIAAAPGRVNLIGEHTDYNDGFVLPMAIQRYVLITAAADSNPQRNGQYQLCSSAVNERVSFSLDDDAAQLPTWVRYVYGVMVGCRERGIACPSLDLSVESNVPLGGGLSSSAALEVATATLLASLANQSLEDVDKALLCQQAEHRYAGVPCGIMDQFTSVMGREDHLMLLDCRTREYEMVPLSDPDVAVLIINSNVKHELTGGEYAQRRSQCEAAARVMQIASLRDATPVLLRRCESQLDDVLERRARHVISENQRTQEAAAGIAAGDWDTVGQLMYASHASLRDDYEVSCDELDLLVRLAREAPGVIGSRMTGGGFGGCTVSLVRIDDVSVAAAAIRNQYVAETGIEPTLFTTRPAQGAHVVQP